MHPEHLNSISVNDLKLDEVHDSQIYVSLTKILKLTNKVDLFRGISLRPLNEAFLPGGITKNYIMYLNQQDAQNSCD